MTRREEREHIFKLLFLTEFYKEEELEQQEMMYYEGISDAKQEDLTYIRKSMMTISHRELRSTKQLSLPKFSEAIPLLHLLTAFWLNWYKEPLTAG